MSKGINASLKSRIIHVEIYYTYRFYFYKTKYKHYKISNLTIWFVFCLFAIYYSFGEKQKK